MTDILFADTETYSEVDLRSGATHNYADQAEVMLWMYALNDEPVKTWDRTTGAPMPKDLANALYDPKVLLVFQNSAFDRTVLRRGDMRINLPVQRFHDTMVQAMVHSLPGALEKIGQIIGLTGEQAKDKDGKKLIQLFCKPQANNRKIRRATRETHPEEWKRFIAYGERDVEAMRHAYKKLPMWNYRGRELALWHLDQRINDRGFQCDVEFATKALAAAKAAQATLRDRVRDETEGAVSSATKRDQLLKYILEEHGVTLPDLTSDTLKRRLEDPELPEGVKLLIQIRLEAGMASSSKYKALINAVSPDGRLRNTLQFAGAIRTCRWAGRVFQPQNMKRPDMEQEAIDLVILAVKEECLDLTEVEPMRALANAVRGCIIAPEGKKLCIADLSNIEGRVLVWLAGEAWKLKAFKQYDTFQLDANGNRILDKKGDPLREGPDMYIAAYARAFNMDPAKVTKSGRQKGKVMELALGYEGGVGAFLTFAAVYQMDLDELAKEVWASASHDAIEHATGMWNWTVKKRRSTFGLTKEVWIACEILKALWREAHPAVVELWKDAASAMRSAFRTPGVAYGVGKHIKVQRDGVWTRVRLPSGRVLCYLDVQVADDGQISYQGINQYTRQWGRIKTYGGKLVENWTQAVARDVMGDRMPDIDNAGYEIVLSVHDELLTETPDTDEWSSDTLAAMMATNPAWADGLPLAAAGFETYRYRKD